MPSDFYVPRQSLKEVKKDEHCVNKGMCVILTV